MNDYAEQLKQVCNEVREREPMAPHTSMKVGGPARYFCVPQNEEELQKTLQVLQTAQIPFFALGNGTNVLFSDEGYDGAVISLEAFPAAKLLSAAAAEAAEEGLSGLEALSGIPGSLGGALYMNAGAYGSAMADVVTEATVLNPVSGQVYAVQAKDMELGYRTSRFQKSGEIILSVSILLQPGKPEEIRGKMAEYRALRISKQPLAYPSCGSFFRRPEGHFAGQLIEEAGLKGLSVGGAQISPQHAGFLINSGGATAADILQLMHVVQATVWVHSGVELKPEVRIVERNESPWKPLL